MRKTTGFGKKTRVEVLYGPQKGIQGEVQSSYMQNKYATYIVRLDGEHGLVHGRSDQFKAVEKAKA